MQVTAVHSSTVPTVWFATTYGLHPWVIKLRETVSHWFNEMAPNHPGHVGHSLFLRSLKDISHLLLGSWQADRAAKAAKRSSEASMTNQSSSLYVEKPKDPSQTMRALLPSAGRETKRASEFRQLVGARRDICERCEKTGHIKKNCSHLGDPHIRNVVGTRKRDI